MSETSHVPEMKRLERSSSDRMLAGVAGAFAWLSVVPRVGGWFSRMGSATLVVYLFHGFAVKELEYLGFVDWAHAHPGLGLLAAVGLGVGIALGLAAPPVRRVLERVVDPFDVAHRRVREAVQLTEVVHEQERGEPAKAGSIIRAIRRADSSGFDIVGVVTDVRGRQTISDVPVVGGFAYAVEAMDATDADTIIVAGADEVHPEMMRQLGWDVADRSGNLVVAPALTDVAGPRIHSRPAAGLPLVHVEFPRLDGVRRFAKRTFDLLGSVVLILVFSPVMLVTAIAIRSETPGPVIYRQPRVGLGGDEFGMLKFRSMVANADDQLASLLDLQGTSDSPLFKVSDDPRITKVGRVIRKHSIDELPQLFNVLVGTMSLVGPRPQRAAEVALYDDAAHRRLRVKPGMSGLWQVSGRSTLSWEDALRLDLYYVENWSFMQDIQILFRTLSAVVAPGRTAH